MTAGTSELNGDSAPLAACQDECFGDLTCPAAHKCCYNGCGYVCSPAVHDGSTHDSSSGDVSQDGDRGSTHDSSSGVSLSQDGDDLTLTRDSASVDDELEDELRVLCSMPLDEGMAECDGRAERYYFDAKDGRCKVFLYTGCGGNRNHFWRLPDCEQYCSRCWCWEEGEVGLIVIEFFVEICHSLFTSEKLWSILVKRLLPVCVMHCAAQLVHNRQSHNFCDCLLHLFKCKKFCVCFSDGPRSCPPRDCGFARCPAGFEQDVYGCPTCLCRDPCQVCH